MSDPKPIHQDAYNYIFRRLGAFIVDVLFAGCIAISIPWTIAQITDGRYRMTFAPGPSLEYCDGTFPKSSSAVDFAERARRAPPPHASYVRTESCTTFFWVFLRNPSIQVVFRSDDRPGVNRISAPTDFDGEVVSITALDGYIFYFEILFLVILLVTARLDSLGMRAFGIRIRQPNGEKPPVWRFLIRYAIIGIVFAPFWFLPSFLVAVGAAFVLAAAAVLPWFRRGPQFRLALCDILAGTVVVRSR
jgi:uncharacterized RDD family membrane protein YckC